MIGDGSRIEQHEALALKTRFHCNLSIGRKLLVQNVSVVSAEGVIVAHLVSNLLIENRDLLQHCHVRINLRLQSLLFFSLLGYFMIERRYLRIDDWIVWPAA